MIDGLDAEQVARGLACIVPISNLSEAILF